MTIRDPNTAHPIVLIHGLWLNALSWEHWVERYRRRGCNVIARSWPGLEGEIANLRQDPSGMEDLGIQEVVDHYAKIIGELDDKPIIIGHSFGGLVAQITYLRRRSIARSPSFSTSRKPSPPTRSSPDGRTSYSASRAGKRWPTLRWSGPSRRVSWTSDERLVTLGES